VSNLWQTPAVVVALLAWLATPPASIGDAAQREAIRRQATPASVTSITNFGLPEPETPPAVLTSPEQGTTLDAPPPTPPAAPEEQHDEKWWRARITAARTSLERNQLLADGMQSRINALQTDVVNRDDPFQQLQLRKQLGQALGELERLKQQIETDQKTIADIQEEARRKDIPPGWIR
jgi:TolA-binding protein